MVTSFTTNLLPSTFCSPSEGTITITAADLGRSFILEEDRTFLAINFLVTVLYR